MEKNKKKTMATCCHRLFHKTTTIDEGDNIVAITFFVAKPSKKLTKAIFFFLLLK
jgi:hypothetical protein